MLPSDVVAKASRDLARFKVEYRGEAPLRIHNGALAPDGSRQWSPEFAQWITGDMPQQRVERSETQMRLTRAMRHLRDVAPREYDVMHRLLSGETTEEIQSWLNDRAERGGHPERYSLKDTVVLIVSGADKLAVWY